MISNVDSIIFTEIKFNKIFTLIIYNNFSFAVSVIKETFPKITDLWPINIHEIFLDFRNAVTRTICISSTVQMEIYSPLNYRIIQIENFHASKRSVIFNNRNKTRVYDTCISKFPLSKKKKKRKKVITLLHCIPDSKSNLGKVSPKGEGKKKISDHSLESSVSNFKPCFV